MKSLILLFMFYIGSVCSASDYLTYVSNNPPWNNYLPSNYSIVKKKGDAAFYWSSEAEAETVSDRKLISREPYIIYKPNSLIEVERKTNTGLLIYKNKYTIDELSRRFVAVKQEEKESKRNLIFLGCSFTFGTGVSDDENFPYYFSKYRPHFNVYNMGIDAAGANDIVDDLRSFNRFKDIPKTGGLVVYTALYEHIERSVCNLSCYTNSRSKSILKKSHYQYDSNSQTLVNRGSFYQSQPITSIIYNILSKIGLIESIHIPFKLTDEQIELYVLMVEEMKKTAKEKFKADFFFTMYPGYYENWDRIKPFLKKHNIRYLDLSKMDFKTATNQRQSIVYDGHPTPLANYLYASLIHYQLPK